MPLHVKLLTDAEIGEFKTRAADALNPTRADGDHVTPDLAPLARLLNSSIAAGAFPGPLIDTYLAEPVDTGAVLGVEVARPPSELREDDAVIAAEVKAKILTNGGASLKSHLQRLGLATEGFDAFVLEKEITIFGPPEPPMPPFPPPAPVSPPSPPRKDSWDIHRNDRSSRRDAGGCGVSIRALKTRGREEEQGRRREEGSQTTVST